MIEIYIFNFYYRCVIVHTPRLVERWNHVGWAKRQYRYQPPERHFGKWALQTGLVCPSHTGSYDGHAKAIGNAPDQTIILAVGKHIAALPILREVLFSQKKGGVNGNDNIDSTNFHITF